MNLQENIQRIKSMMWVNESNFFHRRVDLDKVEPLIGMHADQVFYEKESHTKVLRKIMKISEKGVNVIWLRGNHDEFFTKEHNYWT